MQVCQDPDWTGVNGRRQNRALGIFLEGPREREEREKGGRKG